MTPFWNGYLIETASNRSFCDYQCLLIVKMNIYKICLTLTNTKLKSTLLVSKFASPPPHETPNIRINNPVVFTVDSWNHFLVYDQQVNYAEESEQK